MLNRTISRVMSAVLACMITAPNFAYANGYRDLNTRIEESGMDVPLHIIGSAAATYFIIGYTVRKKAA